MTRFVLKWLLSTAVGTTFFSGVGTDFISFNINNNINARFRHKSNDLTQGMPIVVPSGIKLNLVNKVVDKNNNLYLIGNNVNQSYLYEAPAGSLVLKNIFTMSSLVPEFSDADHLIAFDYDKDLNYLAFLDPLSLSEVAIKIMNLNTQAIISSTTIHAPTKAIRSLQFGPNNNVWFLINGSKSGAFNRITINSFVVGPNPKVLATPLNMVDNCANFSFQLFNNLEYIWVSNNNHLQLFRMPVNKQKVATESAQEISIPNVANQKGLFNSYMGAVSVLQDGAVYFEIGFYDFQHIPHYYLYRINYLGNLLTQINAANASGNEVGLMHYAGINENKQLVFLESNINFKVGSPAWHYVYISLSAPNSFDIAFGADPSANWNYSQYFFNSYGQILGLCMGDKQQATETILNPFAGEQQPQTRMHNRLHLIFTPQATIQSVIDHFNNIFAMDAGHLYKIFYSANTVSQLWGKFRYISHSRPHWIKPNVLTNNENFSVQFQSRQLSQIAVNGLIAPEQNHLWNINFQSPGAGENKKYNLQFTFQFNDLTYKGQLTIGVLAKEPQINVTQKATMGKIVHGYTGLLPLPQQSWINYAEPELTSDFYFSSTAVNVKPFVDFNTGNITQITMTYTEVDAKFKPIGNPITVTDNSKGVNLDGSTTSADPTHTYQITVSNQEQPSHVIYLQIANVPAPTIRSFWETNEGKLFATIAQAHGQQLSTLKSMDAKELNIYISKDWQMPPVPSHAKHKHNETISWVIGGAIMTIVLVAVFLFASPRLKVKYLAHKHSKQRDYQKVDKN